MAKVSRNGKRGQATLLTSNIKNQPVPFFFPQEAISNGKNQLESCWTESIAVGGIGFVEDTKTKLGNKGMVRRIEEQEEADRFVLREGAEPYSAVFDPENESLSPYNICFLEYFVRGFNALVWSDPRRGLAGKQTGE